MSVTPFTPQVSPVGQAGGATPGRPAADGAAAAGFAAMVADLLGAQAAGAIAPGPATPPAGAATPDADAEAAPAAEAPTEDAAAESTSALLDGTFVAVTATLVLPTPVAGSRPPSPTAATTSAPTEVTGSVKDAVTSAEQGTTTAVVDATGQAAGRPADTPAKAATESAGTAPATAPAAPAPQQAQPAAPAAVAPHAVTTPITGPATVAPTTPMPAAPAANPVTTQVIPEVTRLVSQGDGTHRLTMKLNPEALGEVRVTLTLRDGEVHVRLAAGDEARRALIEGAPELRRILELSGAGETRVVVRDLGQLVTGTSQTTPYSAGTGEQRGDTATTGHGRGGPHDQHAGTRGGNTARDGLTDGAHAPRPEPVSDARSSGVDVTM